MEWAETLSVFCYAAGCLVSAAAAAWVAQRGDRTRSDRTAGVAALLLTANWCFLAAVFPGERALVSTGEIAANLAWIMVVFRLFANDGRDETLRLVRPVAIALGFVELCQLVLLLVGENYAVSPDLARITFETAALFRMLAAVGALVLLHNLYVGASQSSRRILRWNAAALVGLYAFNLNFFTIAYLVKADPVELLPLRGVAIVLVAVPFALGFAKSSGGLTFSPSRAVTFRALSLGVIAAYLLAMFALASSLDMLAGGTSRLAEIGVAVAAGALGLIWLPSARLRGWLRVTAIKHLFKHRYDYRSEWIRFTATIGRSGLDGASLQERAVKALADITDSPGGYLLVVGEEGYLAPAGHWRWASLDVPMRPVRTEMQAIFEREGLIVDLDEARSGIAHQGELEVLPEWLLAEPRAWAAVPLRHYDRLVGVIVLARPLVRRELDWEDFDLLGIVGQQIASYLAEQAGQEALSEVARFDEFNRRMAFVMHDIKNLSSQMSLLLRNAEKHADNPEFRKDMLVTLRNSADKLNTMLARLGRYEKGGHEALRAFDLADAVKGTLRRFQGSANVTLVRCDPAMVNGQPEAFEQALAHIVQNAIDASRAGDSVMVDISSDGLSGTVQVVDNGTGMSASFLRSSLFKPFVSSKDGGFGIGAFEAREIIRAMGGRLDVESREGLGTRFSITLPLSSATTLLGESHVPDLARSA